MSSVVHFINNIDAMLGVGGPLKFATLPPTEKRECTLYYGLRELSEEVAASHALLKAQQQQIAQLQDALRAVKSRMR